MDFLGVSVSVKNVPELEPGFLPVQRFNEEFLKGARTPIGIAVERADGETAVLETFIYGTEKMRDADYYYIDRLVKTLLWMKGGFRIYVRGAEDVFRYLKSTYCEGGRREFDRNFMADVYEHPFELVLADSLPVSRDTPKLIGGHLNGCRIGFDAGGSDRKVSAVMNGQTVYSEEVSWFPETSSNPDYHYDGIVSAFRSAAARLPRVDAVGISSAGIYIANQAMKASLFRKVPPDLFKTKVRNLYIRAVRNTFGDIPFAVANDGDVTALAGALMLKTNNILGIAMGTSEAAGYVDPFGRVTGWLNELAFVPVDVSLSAVQDTWSGDTGCGGSYFSQNGIIRLASRAGIEFRNSLSPAEKLRNVQHMMEQGDRRAAAVFRSVGCCLAHTLVLYHSLYGFKNLLLLGRVMSGSGGDTLLETCREVLADEYPVLASSVTISLPDETFRRTGQSAAAASLPVVLDSHS